jgi:hypothetical protein
VPTVIPTVTPTIQKMTWAVFSSAPTIRSNIPPTRVPTISLFFMEGAPTLIPYVGSVQSGSPTVRTTASPTQQSTNTQRPSSLPTVRDTLAPTTVTLSPTATNPPSVLPTVLPSVEITPSPSSGANVLSSNGGSVNSSPSTNSNVIYVTVIVICILICAGIFVFFYLHKKKVQTPFTKWTTYYDNRDTIATDRRTITNDEDIHHFYTKRSQPAFVPHISKNNMVRKSMPNQRYSVAL